MGEKESMSNLHGQAYVPRMRELDHALLEGARALRVPAVC
jgi:hypothetical protein